jgi:hypothetical protein|tara:strand:- start:85 stop:378 length:294 start_codon:yes stop_codon:yes gene_type:complete
MNKFYLIFLILFLSSCQTIENKSQKIIEEENERLGKFIQKPESELKIELGQPDKITFNNEGSKFFIYKTKKYRITCERIFEIDKSEVVVGFSSKNCF